MTKDVFTKEEIEYLLKFGSTVSRAELARQLGRTSSGIGKVMRRNQIPVFEGAYKKWSRSEVARLYVLVDRWGFREIAKILGRTPASVFKKIQSLNMRTRANVYSMESAARETGYHQYQLKRAREALGQQWTLTTYRTKGKKGRMQRYTISPNQLEKLCEYLKTDPLKYTPKHLRAA
jgi:IS30 family transposase